MGKAIAGRKREIERLEKYATSDRSEFIAIYGRRRVGKTYLIKELFDKRFTFRLTGKENASLKEQLLTFSYAMADAFGDSTTPQSWTEAFRMLSKAIERQGPGPKIIFIDELPWLDTPRAQFISAFEHFWNNWAYYRDDIKLIVCGSATSWMLDKVINSRDGLHNRVTHSILISPFSLGEVEEYFQMRGFRYERTEIIDSYMAVGGVAYYLSLFDKGKSVAENINDLCFSREGELVGEFDKVYKSLFKKADPYIEVIKALSTKGRGLTRTDIVEATGLPNNGNLTALLEELEQCEFIRGYTPFGKTKKERMYQLIDQFSLFSLRFIRGHKDFGRDYWTKKIGTGEYNAWCGYAFETVCLHHIDQIVDGIGIRGTINTVCSWTYRPSKAVAEDSEADEDLRTGCQIDLLIDRNDKTITICEMKYSAGEYEIDREYDKRVEARLRTFRKVTKTRKTLTTAYVTPIGLHDNAFARRVNCQVTEEYLFRH